MGDASMRNQFEFFGASESPTRVRVIVPRANDIATQQPIIVISQHIEIAQDDVATPIILDGYNPKREMPVVETN